MNSSTNATQFIGGDLFANNRNRGMIRVVVLFVFSTSISCTPRNPGSTKVKSREADEDVGYASEYKANDFLALTEQGQLHAYARACEKELGKIPLIDCKIGTEIPIEASGHNAQNKNSGTTSVYNGSWNESRKCDRPSFLLSAISGSGSCAPHSKVGRLAADTGFNTEWIFVCRKYFDRPVESTRYDDVNLIGYNRDTGATCFFNSKVNEEPPKSAETDKGVDAEIIPSIHSPDSLNFYTTLKENASANRCISCHSGQAWLRTPYIQQVQWQGQPIVPSVGAKDPYYLVAYNYMEAVHPQPWRPKYLNATEAKACTGCHRIGGDTYASYIAPSVLGIADGLLGQEGLQVSPKISETRIGYDKGLHFELERPAW